LSFIHPFLFSVQGTNRHVSDITFLWPDIFVWTYHVVEDHETVFGSDWNHLQKMELSWNLSSWLLILSATQDVHSDSWKVLVHRHDGFDLIGRRKADITAAEDVFEDNF
jgi:hypothetical protein